MSLIKRFKQFIQIFSTTLLLFTGIDYFFGQKLLNFAGAHRPAELEKKYRISDPNFHHNLTSSYNGLGGWGHSTYRVCTNPYGFKSNCNNAKDEGKYFDIAFIGDSFTEGIGLPYEETFIGQIANSKKNLKLANLGVASYSPSIYLTKVKKLLKEGFYFKELVVYVDISDVQDEAISYQILNGRVVNQAPNKSEDDQKSDKHKIFPITQFTSYKIKSIFKSPSQSTNHLSKDFERAAWTYSSNLTGYGEVGVNGGIEKSTKAMNELYELLKKNGIKLSVGVYPWPTQILFDNENSRQVRIWKEFCEFRCDKFYNSFPTFFEARKKYGAMNTINKYFMPGDVHHNKDGAKLIADDFIALN